MNSGIYVIDNLLDGKFYIGSSSMLKIRRIQHFSDLRGGRHCNRHLQRSFNKHGEDCFRFSILEYCDEKDRLNKEQNWLDVFVKDRDCYNMCEYAHSPSVGKYQQSQEVLDTMRQRMNDPSYNPMSKEKYRLKISDSRRLLSRKECKCIHDEYNNNNITQMQLANKYNVNRQSIRTCLRLVPRLTK